MSCKEFHGPARTVKTPWPLWCEWRPNQLWCWDGSQFGNCAAKHAYAIVDLVSRKWIATHLTATPDSVAARVLFSRGLHNEGLLTDELRARLDDGDAALDDDDDQAPLLLAISDNGTEMHANDTRRFMALCSIAQHFGRPSTPTDQAWIESLWGHLKREHPHLTTITDPAVLAAELERVRVQSRYAGDPPGGLGGLRRWVRWRSVPLLTGSRTVLAAS